MDYAAATNQTACPVGTYNQLNGSDSIAACVDASPGYYANDTGMSIHLACDYGMYQPSPGQTSCLQAEPGYYVSNNGSALQTPCEPGTYNPDSGSVSPSSCIPADPGHYVSEEAMTSQEPCLPGTYQPDGGTDSCIDAATGYYVESSKSTSQTIAAIDHYVDSTGSSLQTQCPSLHITLYEGAVSSEDCLLDSDSDRDPDRDDMDDDNDGINDFYDPDDGNCGVVDTDNTDNFWGNSWPQNDGDAIDGSEDSNAYVEVPHYYWNLTWGFNPFNEDNGFMLDYNGYDPTSLDTISGTIPEMYWFLTVSYTHLTLPTKA